MVQLASAPIPYMGKYPWGPRFESDLQLFPDPTHLSLTFTSCLSSLSQQKAQTPFAVAFTSVSGRIRFEN